MYLGKVNHSRYGRTIQQELNKKLAGWLGKDGNLLHIPTSKLGKPVTGWRKRAAGGKNMLNILRNVLTSAGRSEEKTLWISSSYPAKCGLPAKLCLAVDSFSFRYSTTKIKPCRSQKEQFILTSLENSQHEAQEPRQTYQKYKENYQISREKGPASTCHSTGSPSNNANNLPRI